MGLLCNFPQVYSASTRTILTVGAHLYNDQKRLHGDHTDENQKDDNGLEISPQKSKRHFSFATVVQQVMRNLSLEEFATTFEPLVRKVVREEVERALIPYRPSTSSSIYQSELAQTTPWQLHIEDKLPSTLFTGYKLKSENGEPVKIVIREATSNKTVVSGSLSTLKVEILALDGDFGADDLDNWTEKDFCAKIVCAREGKRPLLTGKGTIGLTDGVGYLTDICFTDNSSWIKSGRFRLGVRSVESSPTEARIREARSDSFVVKDQRGEAYEKHYPPKLEDEVWRLERIGKVIRGRLAVKGIATVKDLLQLYNVEPSLLRDALGSTISNKTWETIIEHANKCILDNKFFVYWGHEFGIVFNSIFKVVAVTFDGQNPATLDKLNTLQMKLVEIAKRNAYKNKNDVLQLDELSPLGSAMLQMSLLLEPSTNSSVQNINALGIQQAGDTLLSSSCTIMPIYSWDMPGGSPYLAGK